MQKSTCSGFPKETGGSLPGEVLKGQRDLYDWSIRENRFQTDVVLVRPNGLVRQKSRTGAVVNSNEKKIAVFRYGNQVFAIDEKCPHLGGPLHLGDIEEMPDRSLCVKCPWHSWKFDLYTGRLKSPKGREVTAVTYPVIVKDDGSLHIGFDQFDPKYFKTESCEF
ncbi:hypothetical protein FSP39_015110 [Pinctada imbricata]|uniref:Rieske domain-containing protein n=1 Tax=Pinctada imbricata TaxID=66713 RepID=A0AA88YPG0_PINIB|nr:hypothetical protein FSP39_015110 [Pinctada imbricata]